MRSVDLVARRLHEAGCRFAFGMPGGEVLTLIDALRSAGIEFVLCKHENAAGFMAEGVYHRSGAPGLLVTTLGPGVANAVNVIANAQQDRVPLIVLSGCVDTGAALRYTHQVLDHRQLLQPLTKASYRLDAANADLIADRAVSTALDGRPGPVHIDVPIEVAETRCATGSSIRRVAPSPAVPAPGAALDRTLAALESAERPLVVAGLEALQHGAESQVLALVEHLQAPLVTTYKAKGIVDESHPLALGAAGLSPLADTELLPLVKEADLIIAAGYDPIEMRSGWQSPWDPNEQTVVELTAAVGNDHYMHHASISFPCDIARGLALLVEHSVAKQGWRTPSPRRVREALEKKFSAPGEWGPATVIEVCREELRPDAIATVDSGAHRILLAQMWKCREPRTLLQSTGLCTMGCAVPLALGAKLAEPERQVAAFTGDAGLLMGLGELATVAERSLPLIIVVFVDASLALIELKQRARQLTPCGVHFGRFDYAAVATALGGEGHRVESHGELTEALRTAQSSAKFSLIACEIEAGDYEGSF